MQLDRPLVVFDLETTGTSITKDRIVQIGLVKLMPNGERIARMRFVNPGTPIPAEATEVHGITDADVKNAPAFRQIASSLIDDWFAGSDIGGFNVRRFDLPLLVEELNRAGVSLDLGGVRILDAQTVYHKKEPRTLEAALEMYCGRPLENAHSAQADAEAALDVILAQGKKYPDAGSVENFADICDDGFVDLSGKLVRNDRDEVVFGFGKHKGRRLGDIAQSKPDYLQWVLRGDFPADFKTIVADAMETTAHG